LQVNTIWLGLYIYYNIFCFRQHATAWRKSQKPLPKHLRDGLAGVAFKAVAYSFHYGFSLLAIKL